MRSTIAREAAVVVVLAMVSWSCSSTMTRPTASETTLFSGGRVIVGDGTLIEHADFVVAGERIIAAGASGEVTAPANANRIDLAGRTVMPAIIDAHSHPGYVNARTGSASWENYTRAHLIEDLERMAYYGVGTSLSLGNDGGHGDIPFLLQNERVPNAARFRTAGPGISTPGGGPAGVRAKSWTSVGAMEEALIAVRALAPRRPSVIKIWVDERAGPGSAMAPQIQRAIIAEAHKFGIPVFAHANTVSQVKELIANRVDTLAHMVPERDVERDRDLIRAMKSRAGLGILPVLPPPADDDHGYTEADLPWIGETLPPSRVERMRQRLREPTEANADGAHGSARSFAVQARNLVWLRDSNVVRIGFGTGGNEGWTAHTELADMVRAGLTPMEALVAATRSNAILLGAFDWGSISPGQIADFIVLDANPLDDISNTRRIHDVYLGGALVDRAALRAKLSAEPSS